MSDSLRVLLQRKGIQSRVDGSTLYVNCPFCGDTRFRRGIELRGGRVPKGTAHCFNSGCPRPKSRNGFAELLGADVQVDTTAEPEQPIKRGPVALPDDYEILNKGATDSWMVRAQAFLVTSRYVTSKQIVDHRIGLSLTGRTRYRLVFPIGEIGWTARTLVDDEPKWLHSPGLTEPYWACRNGKSAVVITEGVFDALAIERAAGNYVDALAILGTNLTEHKLAQIEDYKNICFWLDPDEAGQKATMAIAEKLVTEYGLRVWLIITTPAKGRKGDPGELTNEEILTALRRRRLWTAGSGAVALTKLWEPVE